MSGTPQLTVFTSDRAPLCKRFSVKNGMIHKETLATLYAGRAQTVQTGTATELNNLLDGLDHRQAVSTGTLVKGTSTRITTAAKEGADGLARRLTNFSFKEGKGWLLWDYDAKSMPAAVRQRVADLGGPVAALFHIWPEAQDGAHIIRPSSSDGIKAPGIKSLHSDGLHGFFLVQDVSLSKDMLQTLELRAWNAGLAWVALSASGALLMRSIIDTAVGSPERLIFEAPPILQAPITRDARAPIVSEGKPLGAPALSQSDAGRARATQATARQVIKPKAAKVQRRFIDAKATRQASITGQSMIDARASVVRMMQGSVLTDDYPLQLKDGSYVRAGDLLDAGEANDRLSMPDPMEGLGYGSDKATLLIRPRAGHPDEKPRLISHAHGSVTVYRFARYEPAPQPPFHPGPQGDRADNIAKTGDAVEQWGRSIAAPIRASKAIKEAYAEIDELHPNKRAMQRQARRDVRARLGLNYTPTTNPTFASGGHRRLISGAQGVGKSGALVGDEHKARNQGRAGRPGVLHEMSEMVSLVLAPDHEKAKELHSDYINNLQPDSPRPFHLKGRGQIDTDTGQTMCLIHGAAKVVAKKGGNVRAALCTHCPFQDQCAYLKAEAELKGAVDGGHGVAIFAAQEYAFLPLPRGIKPDAVIIDEALRNLGAKHHEIALDSLGTPLKAEDTGRAASHIGKTAEAADAAAASLRYIQPARVALRDGFTKDPARPYDAFKERGLTVETLQEAVNALVLFQEKEVERVTQSALADWSYAQITGGTTRSPESMIKAALAKVDTKQIERVKALFEATQKDLAKGHDTPTAAWRQITRNGYADKITTADLLKPTFSDKTPLLHLDGTADYELAQAVYGPLYHQHYPVERNAEITQATGHRFTIGSLTGQDKTGKPLNAKSEAEAHKLRSEIIELADRYPKPLIIASARVEASLLKDGFTGATAHYGALRGRNTWEQCETAIIAGPQIPPPSEVERIARAYAANDPTAEPFQSIGNNTWGREPRALRMTDAAGPQHMMDVACHSDPWAELVLRQLRDAEIMQALDRIRLIHNIQPKRVIVLAPVCLDLTVNDVVPWSEMKAGGSRIERAIAETGIVPFCKRAAVGLFPDLWKSTGTAERDLKSVLEMAEGLLAQTPINISLIGKWAIKGSRLVDYKSAPQHGQTRVHTKRALVWADTRTEARRRLEALVGPLQFFSEDAVWLEARDAVVDGLEAQQERAAIIEYEAGLSRADADRIARGLDSIPVPAKPLPTPPLVSGIPTPIRIATNAPAPPLRKVVGGYDPP